MQLTEAEAQVAAWLEGMSAAKRAELMLALGLIDDDVHDVVVTDFTGIVQATARRARAELPEGDELLEAMRSYRAYRGIREQ